MRTLKKSAAGGTLPVGAVGGRYLYACIHALFIGVYSQPSLWVKRRSVRERPARPCPIRNGLTRQDICTSGPARPYARADPPGHMRERTRQAICTSGPARPAFNPVATSGHGLAGRSCTWAPSNFNSLFGGTPTAKHRRAITIWGHNYIGP